MSFRGGRPSIAGCEVYTLKPATQGHELVEWPKNLKFMGVE